MTYFPVQSPYNLFSDTDGEPLESGYIYIGEANQNPITNPINVFWDYAGLYPAAQPIRTIGGYPDRNGSPGKIFVSTSIDSDYSILINDKHQNLVFYSAAVIAANTNYGTYIDTISDLRAIPYGSNTVQVRSHTTIGDNGGGDFEWIDGAAAGTYIDDDGIIIVPAGGDGSGAWIRQYTGPVNLYYFGLDGTGATDVSAGIQNILDNYNEIYIPAGRFLIETGLTTISNTTSPKKITGAGRNLSIIDFVPTSYSAANDTALWIGNYTENIPSPIYESRYLELSDFSIFVGVHARVGLRLRENLSPSVKNLFIGAENFAVITDLVCLYCDGIINGNFESIDAAPKNGYDTSNPTIYCLFLGSSSTLDRSAGSGSGAAATSSSFRNCYFHYAGIVGYSYTNNCNFIDCIFESCFDGLYVSANSFNTQLKNCYYENILGYSITANGTDARVGANLSVIGGYYNSYNKSGFNSDSFLLAKNAGKVKITELQVYGNTCIGKIFTASGTNHSIVIDSSYYPLHSDYAEAAAVALTNAFATTIGDPALTITYNSHGYVLGDIITLNGFTTPLSSVPVNLPFWEVTDIISINQFKATPLYNKAYNASATTSGVGGSGTMRRYGGTYFGNVEIDDPTAVKINDAELRQLRFARTISGGVSGVPLWYEHDGITANYITKKWSYLMSGFLKRSIAQTVSATNYAYVYLNLPTGYEQAYLLNDLPSIAINNYQGNSRNFGIKLPPGTEIYINYYLSGGVGSYVYTEVETAILYLYECNEDTALWT